MVNDEDLRIISPKTLILIRNWWELTGTLLNIYSPSRTRQLVNHQVTPVSLLLSHSSVTSSVSLSSVFPSVVNIEKTYRKISQSVVSKTRPTIPRLRPNPLLYILYSFWSFNRPT